MKSNRNILFLFLALCLMVAGLSSCGGSGGSVNAGGESGLPVSSSKTGSVAVLLTDSPSSDFSAILITILKIELLSDEGRYTVFSGRKTVNLLDLKNETTLFSIEDNVPAIQYNKIRLTAEKVVLVDKKLTDSNGDPKTYSVKLPGNNKVDLNPREPFAVIPGEALALHLDMDADKCIHIVEKRKGKTLEKEYQFRPVVFVRIIRNVQLDDLVRASGVVRDIDMSENQFKLCMNDLAYVDASDHDSDGDEDSDSNHDSDGDQLNDAPRCILVSVTNDTSFFHADKNGRAVDFEDLNEGDEATVIGFYETRTPARYDMNEAFRMILDASVVEIGEFSKLKGTILDESDDVEISGNAWMDMDYDDSGWSSGSGIFGTEQNLKITTPISNKNLSIFFRKTFTVCDPSEVTALTLNALFDDGIAVYINGTQVYIENVIGDPPPYNGGASPGHEAEDYEAKNLTSVIGLEELRSLLVAGSNNVIAVGVYNVRHPDYPDDFSSDIVWDGELLVSHNAKEGEVPGCPEQTDESIINKEDTWKYDVENTSSTKDLKFRLDPGQGFGTGTEVTLVLQDETKIYSSRKGAFLDDWTKEDLLGKSAEIDGILLLSDAKPDTLVAAFILIDGTAAASEKLSGTVDNIDYRAGTFDLVISRDETVCVNVPEDGDIFLIIGLESSEMIDFTELYDGINVDLYGDEDESGSDCFIPDTIIAFESD